MKVYNVNIKDLTRVLIEIYEAGYNHVDIEKLSDDRIKLIPVEISKKEEPKIRTISPDTNLENLI